MEHSTLSQLMILLYINVFGGQLQVRDVPVPLPIQVARPGHITFVKSLFPGRRGCKQPFVISALDPLPPS